MPKRTLTPVTIRAEALCKRLISKEFVKIFGLLKLSSGNCWEFIR